MKPVQTPPIDPKLFTDRVLAFVAGDERTNALASLRQYMSTYTGRAFERLAGADPMRFTADDIVAVSTLGVDIPAPVSLWLLSSQGQAETTALLREIPRKPIWDPDADLSPTSAAWQLWDLLRRHHGMGRTKTSKLLAAKRPDLIPIYDQHVGRALAVKNANTWICWQGALHSSEHLRQEAEALADDAGAASLSVLRTLDIVIWMRVHGYAWASKDSLPYDSSTPLGP